jgi:hypothetical protein
MQVMQTFRLLSGTALVLLAIYSLVIVFVKEGEQKRDRAEIHMLYALETVISRDLEAGGQLPTKWSSLSNSVDWRIVNRICEYNGLPAPEEGYALLLHPVGYRDFDRTGSVFLVRSKPIKRFWSPSGRWGFMLGGTVASYYTPGTSNQVLRVWLKENELPRETKSGPDHNKGNTRIALAQQDALKLP